MNIKNRVHYGAAFLFAALLMMPAGQALAAEAQHVSKGAQIGLLECHTVEGSGFSLIISSTADIKCRFEATGGVVENYRGETGVGLGIDLHWDKKTKIVYTVFAANYKAGSYQLTGKYLGGGGSATVGVGVGAQVLIGGGSKSFSLEPALSGSTGAGVSAGLTYLNLEPDR
ncbi:MAG: DUF992 domain-containing protein [Mariprofundaceae bacterium]